jgi:glutamate decarboxylase
MQMCCLQVCWEKFTRYFDVEEKFVHLTNDCFVLTPEKAIELVDENTIGEITSSSPGLP